MEGLSINDIIWDSSEFVFDIVNNSASLVVLNSDENEFTQKIPRPSKALVDIKQYKKLLEIKEKIANCTHWDKWSKLTNPYDKIQYLAKNRNTKDYYKYFELFRIFNISNENLDTGDSAHMGESSLHAAKALSYYFPKINWYVNSENESSINKSFKESQTDLNKMLESDMLKATDEKGYSRIINNQPELSLAENLKEFRETVGKVNIITADCTVDTTHDPSNQEQLVFYLLFLQIVSSLHMQAKEGHMIVKIFDTMTRSTCQLIYYLTNFYERVSLVKPRTSRYTNSEKFIVAKNFKGISSEELNKLDKIINTWSNLNKNTENYLRIMGINIPEEIESQFMTYNNFMVKNQYSYIDKTIRCNYNEEEIPAKQLEAFQNKNALLFCSNFGIPVNLIDSDISMCKHSKKNKISLYTLKNTVLCEKCLTLITKN